MAPIRLEAFFLGLRTRKQFNSNVLSTGKTMPFPLPGARSKDRAFFIFKGGQITLFAERGMVII